MVTSSKKKWIQAVEPEKEETEKIAKELEVSPLFVEVCFQRGLTSVEQIENFISVDENWFHDPFLMYDMEKGIERIIEAVQNEEQITIYGDYDADGMTSTALIVETLDSIGANVNYYLPNRFVEGYGPNIEAFQTIINDGTQLIITVDNGVAGHEALTFAKGQGIDVIVTDHHEIPDTLPEAYAIIHPNHPEGDYPFKDLAGVGVALKVATALTDELPAELLDLAAIGTVADLVELTGENRAIVYFGLQMLQNTQRAGLLQLLNVIEKEPSKVDEETIGFQIAPRLNAVGRLGDGSPCVELLCTHDLEKAKVLAGYVNEQNEERKDIVEEMTEDVLLELETQEEEQSVVVLANENWHQGVLGIVASRIVEQTKKPTLLFTIDAEAQTATGSARSIETVNLYEAFSSIEHYFLQFGGHHMAAGMSAEVDQLPEIQKGLTEHVKEIASEEMTQTIDAFSSIEELSIEAIKELDKLRPFGTGNKKPVISCQEVNVVQNRKVGSDGDHLKLTVAQEDHLLDIISFQNGKISDLLFEQQEISIAGFVEINEWNGFTKPQMQMIDVDIPGPILIDQRLNQLAKKNFEYENTEYLFYNEATYDVAKELIPSSAKAVLLNTKKAVEEYVAEQDFVIVDCPNSIEQFTKTIQNNLSKRIRCYFYKNKHLFLTGLPNRADFAKVYKYFATHKNIDLKNEGNLLIQHLQMESEKVFLIVQVFLEANFVIIEDGLLNIVEQPEKIDLNATQTFKNAKAEMLAEELFLYSSFKEIIAVVNQKL